MAVKYLDAKRLQGTNAERTGAIWNQTSEADQFGFNNYVTTANISPVASTSVIGQVLKKFTLKLKRAASPASEVVTFGVWAVGNITRGSPTTEFECTSHTLTNLNQLTTSFVEYTFEPVSPATGHTLVALDSIGLLQDSSATVTANHNVKRASSDSTDTRMSSTIFYRSSPEKWYGNDTNQCPTSTGYGTPPDWSDLEVGTIYIETDTYKYYWWNGSTWSASG